MEEILRYGEVIDVPDLRLMIKDGSDAQLVECASRLDY